MIIIPKLNRSRPHMNSFVNIICQLIRICISLRIIIPSQIFNKIIITVLKCQYKSMIFISSVSI